MYGEHRIYQGLWKPSRYVWDNNRSWLLPVHTRIVFVAGVSHSHHAISYD